MSVKLKHATPSAKGRRSSAAILPRLPRAVRRRLRGRHQEARAEEDRG